MSSRKKPLTVEQVVALRRQKIANRRDARSLIFRLVFVVVAAYLLFTQVFLITQNAGQGMFPSLKDGDLCIAFRTTAQTLMKQKYVRDDVVIYRFDDGSPEVARAGRLGAVSAKLKAARDWLAARLPEKAVPVLDWIWLNPQGKRFFGRVVAAEGDVVNISETGSLIVNGTTQGGEILFPTELRGDLEYPCRVPEGCVFVLGDYRTNTRDSRDFGPIPLEEVEGKVISILRRRGL